MAGEKLQELARIAFIGNERIVGKTPHGFQRFQPFLARCGKVGARRDQKFAICRHGQNLPFGYGRASLTKAGYRQVAAVLAFRTCVKICHARSANVAF
ncbi:Uncharacterised protein [Brucella neotomae]|nr:Uncharacterised protein [Brucella neotomae]